MGDFYMSHAGFAKRAMAIQLHFELTCA